MPLRRSLLVSLCFLAVGTPLAGQDPAAAPRLQKARDAIAPLQALVGQWEGEATVTEQSGRVRIRQTEDVSTHSFASVLVIKGRGHGLEAPITGKVVFEATAVLWFDADSGRVRMRTFRDGGTVEPSVEMKPDTIVWGFPVRGGRIVYTIAYKGDDWHEVGHFLREGMAPIQIIDLRLRKKTP